MQFWCVSFDVFDQFWCDSFYVLIIQVWIEKEWMDGWIELGCLDEWMNSTGLKQVHGWVGCASKLKLGAHWMEGIFLLVPIHGS